MRGRQPKLYQDQLYGAQELSPLAVAIIDTPEYQRLSGLRQLGFADVVYRGAQHTRFEHSVGAYILSRTLIRHIVQNHERLGLEHPGKYLSPSFRLIPENAEVAQNVTTLQSLWRGLSEVVSSAALLHDLGHVPFGHTLEDEFAGLYKRHDRLAGPRFYEMLFNESSDLAKVFSDSGPRWMSGITNEGLRRLIYVILSWKESVNPPESFKVKVEGALREAEQVHDGVRIERLRNLLKWYDNFVQEKMFHPFMTDIVGNTICADLLDYLPRDRQNLGMEPRFHTRLQRFLTIREGTLYENEGARLSIMVTRKGRGGQRPDVATAVLDIMRERYEMAERVFYHHKKVAASSMLAKLIELSSELKPRDDGSIYPAPWEKTYSANVAVPHTTHLSDSGLIDYLGNTNVGAQHQQLQRRLYAALRFRRKDMYRTLLVVDIDLVRSSTHGVSYYLQDLRGKEDEPSSEGRRKLEAMLESAAQAKEGDVIVYCPSGNMQAKEVDARLEIDEKRVLPLRLQEKFVYRADVDVIQRYYEELWRAYVFVSPELFEDPVKCKSVVDRFCDHYSIPKQLAYPKVRSHKFIADQKLVAEPLNEFMKDLPWTSIPTTITGRLLVEAEQDNLFVTQVNSGANTEERLASLLDISILKSVLDEPPRKLLKKDQEKINSHINQLLAGSKPAGIRAFGNPGERLADFNVYLDDLLTSVLGVDKN